MNTMLWIRRDLFKMMQYEFAQEIGRSPATVCRWEGGQLKPDLEDLKAIRELAAARGVDWHDNYFFQIPTAIGGNVDQH